MMTALGFLVPVGVIGLVAWIVVGFIQTRKSETFTLVTATALYARVLFIVGVLLALSGIGNIVKALFGFINLNYSYFDYNAQAYKGAPAEMPSPPTIDLTQERGQDIVLGITLVVIGLLVAVTHYYLARTLASRPGGSPGWVARGTVLALAVTTAVGAIPTAAIGLYGMLSYFVIGAPQAGAFGPPQTWGDPLGAAIAFVPAWIYVMTRLVRDLRTSSQGAPGQQASVALPTA